MHVWSCLPWVARGSIAFIRKKRTVQTPEHKSRHRKRFKPPLVCLRPKKTWGWCSDEIFSDKRFLKKCVEPRKKNRTQKIKHFFKRFYPLLYCFAWALCALGGSPTLVLETQHEQTVFVRIKLFLFFFRTSWLRQAGKANKREPQEKKQADVGNKRSGSSLRRPKSKDEQRPQNNEDEPQNRDEPWRHRCFRENYSTRFIPC